MEGSERVGNKLLGGSQVPNEAQIISRLGKDAIGTEAYVRGRITRDKRARGRVN